MSGLTRLLETAMAVIARVPRVLTCPGCQRHLRWPGAESGRVRCPSCQARFIALIHPSGECKSVPESDEAVELMIADWLGPNWVDEDGDDFAPETAPSEEVENGTSNAAPRFRDPTVLPVIVASPAGIVATREAVPPENVPTRKAG